MYMPMYNLLGSSSTITYRWDTGAGAGIQDGTGTWGTDSFWTSNGGVTRVAWVSGSIAQFGGGSSGTAGTVATSGTPTCSTIIFNLPFGGNYIISTALTLVGLATVTANGGAPNISAVISGSAGFRKNGTGTLVISGVNTFTGTVYIDDGILTIFNSAALNVTHPVIMHPTTATTLNVVSQCVIGSLTGGPNAIVSGAGLTCGGDNTSTIFAGNRSGSSGLTKAGSGTFTLTGTNATTGTLTVSAGTVQLGNAGTTGSIASTSISISSGATLSINRSDAVVFSNVCSGAGTLQIAGTNTVSLTGANTHSGGTTVSSGTLSIGNAGTTGEVGSGTVTNNTAILLNRSNAHIISALIAGAGTIEKLNANTTSLTGTNTCSGDITISAGTLSIGNAGAVGTAGTSKIIVTSGTTLTINRNNTITIPNVITGTGTLFSATASTSILTSNSTFSGTVSNSNSGVTVQIGNGSTTGDLPFSTCSISGFSFLKYNRTDTLTVSGVITSGQLQQTGSGTLILTGNNTTINGTTVTAGTLQVGNGGTVGVLNLATGSGAAVLSAGATLSWKRSDSISFGGQISGAGSVVHAGSGTLTFTTNNTYTGTTTINGGGALRLGGTLAATAITVANATGNSIGSSAAATRTIAGSVTFAGSNAALDVQTNGTTVASRLTVTGGVIRGGAKVNVLGALNVGSYIIISGSSGSSSGAEFTIGTNASGRTCTFSTVAGVTTMTCS